MKKIEKEKLEAEVRYAVGKKAVREDIATRKKLVGESILPKGCETLNQKLMREGKIKKARYETGMK